MARTQTHFEQVPKAVIEKILAKQDLQAAKIFDTSGEDTKPSLPGIKIPARPLSKS